MLACLTEMRRILRTRAFWAAALLTVFVLWAELGSEIYWLLHGATLSYGTLLQKALTGEGNLLALPLLAALPAAAAARRELSGGAVPAILFRCGRKKYLVSRFFSVVLGALLSQTAGILLFAGVLAVFLSPEPFPAALLFARLLIAAVFALTGSIAALLTRDAVCACVVPSALCFSLSMLRERFFTEAAYLDPLCWLDGGSFLFPAALLFFLSVLFFVSLSREVRRYV